MTGSRWSSFVPCPAKGCRSGVRRSTLVCCPECYASVPAHIRNDFAQAYEACRLASHEQRAELRARLDEARDLVLVTAEGNRARAQEQAADRAWMRRRSMERVYHSVTRPGTRVVA